MMKTHPFRALSVRTESNDNHRDGDFECGVELLLLSHGNSSSRMSLNFNFPNIF
jgi:hypothetical protein